MPAPVLPTARSPLPIVATRVAARPLPPGVRRADATPVLVRIAEARRRGADQVRAVMADVILDRVELGGSCSEADLEVAGFAPAEILALGHEARDAAATRLARREAKATIGRGDISAGMMARPGGRDLR